MKTLSFLLVLSFLLPCLIQAQSINTKDDLRKRWDTFIEHWEKENVDKLVSIYTADAINIPPGLKINEGREAIGNFYQFLFDGNISSKYTHNMIKVFSSEEGVTEYGEFSVDWTRNDGSKWTYYARSMTHWVKDDDGQWRISLFLFNQPPEEK